MLIGKREKSLSNMAVSLREDVAQFTICCAFVFLLDKSLCLTFTLFYIVFWQHHENVRRMSSRVRMGTASAACGTVMVTMTVETTVMSSVVSSGAANILNALLVLKKALHRLPPVQF